GMRAHHLVAERPVNLAGDRRADLRQRSGVGIDLMPDDILLFAQAPQWQLSPLCNEHAVVGHLTATAGVTCRAIQGKRGAVYRHDRSLEGTQVAIGVIEQSRWHNLRHGISPLAHSASRWRQIRRFTMIQQKTPVPKKGREQFPWYHPA